MKAVECIIRVYPIDVYCRGFAVILSSNKKMIMSRRDYKLVRRKNTDGIHLAILRKLFELYYTRHIHIYSYGLCDKCTTGNSRCS